jgi:hypothetical protein
VNYPRFVTACGVSLLSCPKRFCRLCVGPRQISVLSDGERRGVRLSMRDEMARAIEWAATRKSTEGRRFLSSNLGSNDRNHQVKDPSNAVAEALPGAKVKINTATQPDNRSHKIDFSLFSSLTRDYQPQLILHESIASVSAGLRQMRFRGPRLSHLSFDPAEGSRDAHCGGAF